jgi:hypothetical protein
MTLLRFLLRRLIQLLPALVGITVSPSSCCASCQAIPPR